MSALVATMAALVLVGPRAAAGEADPPVAVVGAGEGIRVDGLLDEAAWTRAPPIGPLLQRDPKEGAAASEETEVRVLFDADNLYIGVTCQDRTPSAIVSTQLGRDADLEVDDRIIVVLDPFFDHKNGFFFAVNPAGARADGQISNNAQVLTYEWDAIWDARTRITDRGWVAEIAIPFKSLRFKPGRRSGASTSSGRSSASRSETAGLVRAAIPGSGTSPQRGRSRGSPVCSRGGVSTSVPSSRAATRTTGASSRQAWTFSRASPRA